MAVAARPGGVILLPASGAVPQQLRRILLELRSEQLSFERAWEEALGRVTWPTSQRETIEWERALDSTRAAWRASYERWETVPSEGAVAGLHEGLTYL